MKFLTLIEIEIKKILPWLGTLFIGLTAYQLECSIARLVITKMRCYLKS